VEISSSISNTYQNLRTAQRAQVEDVSEVASTEPTPARDITTQDRASTEQSDIVNSLQTNARSLQAAGERIGTLIDVQA
jgi:hypothetical protein